MPRLPKSFKGNRKQGKKPFQQNSSDDGGSKDVVVTKEANPTSPPPCDKCRRFHFGTTCVIPRGRICYACREPGHYVNSCPIRSMDKPDTEGKETTVVRKKKKKLMDSQFRPEESIVWERISPPRCEQCKEFHFGLTCDVPPGLVCFACKRPGHYARDCPYPPKQKRFKRGRSD